LPLAKFFQHADLAIGFDQRLTAAFDFDRHVLPLLSYILLVRSGDQFESLGLDEPVDIDSTGRYLAAAKLSQCGQFQFQVAILLSQHLVDTIAFGQRRTALVAPCFAKFQQGFESKNESAHRYAARGTPPLSPLIRCSAF
jgi:hypothetical protein